MKQMGKTREWITTISLLLTVVEFVVFLVCILITILGWGQPIKTACTSFIIFLISFIVFFAAAPIDLGKGYAEYLEQRENRRKRRRRR